MSKITFDREGMETNASVRRRIAEATGFQYSRIKLLEGSFADGFCETAYFSVNGLGFWTNFEDYNRARWYDAAKDRTL